MERQLTVRLPEDLYRRLERAAGELHLHRSQVIRMALARFLEESTPQRPYDRLRHLAGAVSSGVPDLGTRPPTPPAG